MDAGRLIRADWSRPWFAGVADVHELVFAPDPVAALNSMAVQRGVTTAAGRRIEFVPADDAPAGRAYETHVAATGRVPTRLNAHDLFNALIWLAMPRTKARLNALQAAAIEREGVGADRGPLRDAATVFDENGALLMSTDANLLALLRERRWREAFVERRAAWSAARLLCFGHALMEKLLAPYKAIAAHVLWLELSPDATMPELDFATAKLIEEGFRTSALVPLPVLGVPRWRAENADPVYYDDASVFRPARNTANGGQRR